MKINTSYLEKKCTNNLDHLETHALTDVFISINFSQMFRFVILFMA